jgi:Acetyltransferase (GNAT) domain
LRIRVFTEDDVPAAAALLARVYPEYRWRSQDACEAYFREMLFENPWCDPEIPSWVAEDRGRLRGFYAAMPRRMLMGGRPIRVAVGCQFMMDPDNRNSLAALQLAKACLSGPQDLTLADGANTQARRMWVAIGGIAPLLYNLHWTRLLRPARCALSLLEGRGVIASPVAFAARPLCAAADALFARLPPNRSFRDNRDFPEETLDAATMLSHFSAFMNGRTLQPEYDAGALAWLLDQAARKKRHGQLRAQAVLGSKRQLIGWYLYYLNAGGVSEVLQIVALEGSFDQVLQRLLADAWKNGAAALRGRAEPRFVQELSNHYCWFRCESPWTLIHSRHAEIVAAIEQGDAFLSRLEGEWWLRFVGG